MVSEFAGLQTVNFFGIIFLVVALGGHILAVFSPREQH